MWIKYYKRLVEIWKIEFNGDHDENIIKAEHPGSKPIRIYLICGRFLADRPDPFNGLWL